MWTQRKTEFGAIRHVVKTVMTQTENMSVRCEGYPLEKCVWPQTEMESTDKVAELQNTSSYAPRETYTLKWK